MQEFYVENLKQIVLLGASPTFSQIIEFHRSEKIETQIVTSPAQLEELPKGIEPVIFEELDGEFEKFVQKNCQIDKTLFISFGARWIFKKKTIEGILGNHLVNFHGTRLPLDAGGGGFSWRIMRGDRIGMHLVHWVDEGIDTGPIIDYEQFLFPAHLTKPIHYQDFQNEGSFSFYKKFIAKVRGGSKFEPIPQVEYLGRYNPRLKTDVHGYIDWRQSPQSLWKFIAAFDDPYPGAITFHHDKPVRIKSAHLHGGETPNHEFMSGLVMRHDRNWLVVATTGPEALLIEKVISESGENLLPKIKPGDRFYTSQAYLDTALSTRAIFGSRA